MKKITILYFIAIYFCSCKSTSSIDYTKLNDIDKYNIMRNELGLIEINKKWIPRYDILPDKIVKNKKDEWLREGWNISIETKNSVTKIFKKVARDKEYNLIYEIDTYVSGDTYKPQDTDMSIDSERFAIIYNYQKKILKIGYSGCDIEILQLFERNKPIAVFVDSAIMETDDGNIVKEMTAIIMKKWGIKINN
jgi:hypothetical protein